MPWVIVLPDGRGKSWETFVLFKAREEALLCPSEPPEIWADKLELLWVLWILEQFL